MLDTDRLSDFLKSRLTREIKVCIYHISTAPTQCPPLYAPGPKQSPEPTTLESHFLALSQAYPRAETATDGPSDVLVLGVEVLVFTTTSLTTVFVSKADSTGFFTKSNETHVRSTSLARTAITSFLEYLLLPRLSHTRVVLSLFARSQNQYLFPGSIENATKHVLDDRQLIKWWCRVLDPLVRWGQTDDSPVAQAYVVVPGCDRAETRAFFPTSVRSDPGTSPLWLSAYPVDSLVDDTSLPPRCLVPRLPDDPKSRFLDDLDEHGVDDGRWRNVKTLDQFWEMMSYRQECSAGRLVGFVWVVFSASSSSRKLDSASGDLSAKAQQRYSSPHQDDSETGSALKVPDGSIAPQNPAQDSPPTASKDANRLTPTIEATVTAHDDSPPSADGVQTSNSSGEALNMIKDIQHVGGTAAVDPARQLQHGPTENVRLTADDYQALMDVLLQLDFAGSEMALQSTKTWREKAATLAGLSGFGTRIQGEKEVEDKRDTSARPQDAVNVLTGVRKKRKVQSDERSNELVGERLLANTLATHLVRKKAKS